MARPEWAAAVADNTQNAIEAAARELGIPCLVCAGDARDGTAICSHNPMHVSLRTQWAALDRLRTDRGRATRQRRRPALLEHEPGPRPLLPKDYGGDTASGLLAESEPPAERDRAARSAPAPHAGAENGPKTPAAKQALGANPIPAPSGVDGGPP